MHEPESGPVLPLKLPMLRPHERDSRQGGHSTVDEALPIHVADDAGLEYDIGKLPHDLSDHDIERLFPSIGAADANDNVDDWRPETLRRHHQLFEFQGERRKGKTGRLSDRP